ncbi:hypothetical protein SUGI_0962760 [Cryptomeria japonica]|nr:hypothetical protein SUGI_0962760 [Cryptomeria japonica]
MYSPLVTQKTSDQVSRRRIPNSPTNIPLELDNPIDLQDALTLGHNPGCLAGGEAPQIFGSHQWPLSGQDNRELLFMIAELYIHRTVVDIAYEVIELKRCTCWAIGYSAANLVKSLLRNQRRIHAMSALAKGFHKIKDEVFLSMPSLIGRKGVLSAQNFHFTEEETHQLRHSAQAILDVQKQLSI